MSLTDDLFRARAIEFQTQKALGKMMPLDYLSGALDDSGELTKALAGLCKLKSGNRDDRDSDRPGQRFMNMVHRDNDVLHWVAFLCHEQERKVSPWKEGNLRALPAKLKEWRASLNTENERDLVVCQVEQALRNIVPDLKTEERVRIGLRAFRTMLWQLRTGGGQE